MGKLARVGKHFIVKSALCGQCIPAGQHLRILRLKPLPHQIAADDLVRRVRHGVSRQKALGQSA